ncbi:DUF3107 domain-containing protein [Microbacterium hominis]|uniref:DUF3107 domain-containing protein n=1 Tax=Microbacterium hominis TaxID=162426 RepID=A0A134DG15_9MICO|nr:MULTISPECIES: DUF3107 domain-containing protein [Microbacterium]AUG29324.1 DUF3107 domain-containing protein [Microbacterium hominis]KXC05487.1 ATP-binding protein [Microbacterium hominis]QOC25231.1 DUF3107 domain-containing protein [Microbacterium hominis]QOC29258.1 DUF3107 domain-containing protein [Microbacterium hominis]QRY40779.1 DUF3107 domain-containing protein [Microbacterium hominis]
MEIRIGIANTPRELSFESALSAEAVTTTVQKALASDESFVTFTDVKGNTYIVPTAGITFIEVGTEESRRVGFVA